MSNIEIGRNVILPDEKPTGIFIRYTGVSGEAEFAGNVLISYDGSMSEKEAVHNFFQDFFGGETEKENDYCYISSDYYRGIKIKNWTTVSVADYTVLAKYF